MPANATEEEKLAIKDQQKEVAELRAQLEIAETKRRSASLYTRNIARTLAAGREQLEGDAERERRRG